MPLIFHFRSHGLVRISQVRERTGKGSSHTSDLLGDLVEVGELVKLKRGVYDLPQFAESEQASGPSHSASDDSRVSEWALEQGGASPGAPGRAGSLQVDDRLIRSYLGRLPNKDEAFFCELKGDSMQPWLSEGDYVFALRAEKVSVSGRYVVWWGEDQAQICVHLSLIGENAEEGSPAEEDSETEEEPRAEAQGRRLKLKKSGPEETMRLRSTSSGDHEGRVYKTGQGGRIRMRVRGRVVWPSSTAKSVMETVTDQMGKVFEKGI